MPSPQQLQHEQEILKRLAGIQGVPKSADESKATPLGAADAGGPALLAVLRNEPLTVPTLLALALQLTHIISAVHRRGVLHKHINPANILLVGVQRQPLLINFQLATSVVDEPAGLTQQDEILGTLAYLAPEQTGRTGRTVDQRADLYALGATLYELATGQPPFVAEDELQLIHELLTQVPPPPLELNPCLPLSLSDIIMRLLEKEPDRRYQSAVGLAHDLSRLQVALIQGDSGAFELGERDFPARLTPPTQLIGREDEIAALQSAFDNALIGQCRVVLVEGGLGVGKTALIDTLQPYVTACRGWIVSGKFDQYRQDLETDAVRQALRALGRLLLAEPEAELAVQRARILEALGANAGLLTAMLPEFALLLAVPPGTPTGDAITVERQLIQVGLDLLHAIVSPARPLVIVVDDLQWAAALPTRFIDAILMDEDLRGLLLVCAHSDAEINPTQPFATVLARWEQLPTPPLHVALQNLRPDALCTLLAAMLRLSPARAAALADAIGAHTDGNPYDTVELVNALRSEGILVLGESGWEWDEMAIRHFAGQGEVIGILLARLKLLPTQTQALLQIAACLGGEVQLDLLQAGSDLSAAVVAEQLAPALQDGLLVMEHGDQTLRFRHNRIQQAAYDSLDSVSRTDLHLQLARRLAALHRIGYVAEEQYLRALDALQDPDECRRVVSRLRAAAADLRWVDFVTTERFLTAAITLLSSVKNAADAPLLMALNIDRHLALFNLGRWEEADYVYGLIESSCREPLQLVESACVQISSFNNRNRVPEALTFGFDMLRKLGLQVSKDKAGVDAKRRLDNLCRWVDADTRAEPQRPEASDAVAIAAASLINRLMASANSTFDLSSQTWLVLESQRLWAEHGPCSALVSPLSHASFVTIAAQQDYRSGYMVVRHLLALSEARGYEPATSQARFVFAFSASHWFESLEDTVLELQRARAGLLRSGDLQNACFSYLPNIIALLDCAPTLESCLTEIESGLAFAARTRNELAPRPHFAHRQLVRALRGETAALGSFSEASFDETAYLDGLGQDSFAGCIYHLTRGLAAALFGDSIRLQQHAAAAMPLLPWIQCLYRSSLGYLLQALALAEQIKTDSAETHAALLAELDACRAWLALRAADCPVNFLHLSKWIDAERAWALNDFESAAGAFDVALGAAEAQQRPWHHALITERAALFHLTHGLEYTGRMLLAAARHHYENWGASGKVQQLDQTHGFLRAAKSFVTQGPRHNPEAVVNSIDMQAILRASQALSSETSLPQLQARVVELLGAMTGATQVQLVLRRDEPPGWYLSVSAEAGNRSVSVEEASARQLLPLSALHYAARTQEPLLVADATRDDRFARDPYVAALERCSLLLVPILSKGALRAMLVIENRLSRAAFSAERLDAVKLVAGQLAVSLENALFYEELEQRVAERTTELANSLLLLNATLESTSDGILALEFSGKTISHNTQFTQMWGIPTAMAVDGDAVEITRFVAAQLKHPVQSIARVTELLAQPRAEAFDVLELLDGRIFERYVKMQRIGSASGGMFVANFRDITERRRAEAELEDINKRLLETSRQAGMAEVASNVLHNVGNVLNSVNVSANLVAENMKRSKLANLGKVAELLHDHGQDLAAFITDDSKGKHLPGFLAQLSHHLLGEQREVIKELELLRNNIDHIKEIVAMQQSYSKVSGVKELVSVIDLIEDTLRMNSGALQRHGVQVVREFADVPKINTEKHKILQILVNLVRNAKYACSESHCADKRVIVRVTRNDDTIKIAVIDNGVGISTDNLARIFGHGFTTRKDGHGFGLHSGALAAHELGGSLHVHSDGPGLGAIFTLELPLQADASHA